MYAHRTLHTLHMKPSHSTQASIQATARQTAISNKLRCLQILPDDGLKHHLEDHLDVTGVCGRCEVRIDDLVFVVVARLELALNELAGRVNIAVRPCIAQEKALAVSSMHTYGCSSSQVVGRSVLVSQGTVTCTSTCCTLAKN